MPTNRLYLALPDLSESFRAKIFAAIPANALEVTRDFPQRRTLSLQGRGLSRLPTTWGAPTATRNTYPPYEAGLRVVITAPSGVFQECTTNFSVKPNANGFMGLTAGHCSTDALHVDQVYINGVHLGYTGKNSWIDADGNGQAAGDVLRYAVPDANITHRLYLDSTTYRSVAATRTISAIRYGERMCANGFKTDREYCGNVDMLDVAFSDDDGPVVLHQYAIGGVTMQKGDSGGPVYDVLADGRALAVGAIRLNIGSDLFFSTIDGMLQTIDLNHILSDAYPS